MSSPTRLLMSTEVDFYFITGCMGWILLGIEPLHSAFRRNMKDFQRKYDILKTSKSLVVVMNLREFNDIIIHTQENYIYKGVSIAIKTID